MKTRILLALCLIAYPLACFAEKTKESKKTKQKESPFSVQKKIAFGGDGFWDYITIDSGSDRLYIGRGDRVMVIDIKNEKLIGEVPGMAGVHGIAVASEFNKGFVTCRKDNSVRVFALDSLKEIGQVKAGANPDAVLYDPSSKKVFAFNNGGTTATVIDASSGKDSGTIELGGSAESAVADGKGKVFVNLEDKSEIAVIDSKNLKTTAHCPLAPGSEPTGLALDSKHHRLFSGCHNKLMAIVNADTGKVISTLPIGGGVDACGFDPETMNAFSSNGEGTLTVIHEDAPNKFHVVQNVATEAGARTMALDPKAHKVWLAAATFADAENDKVPQNRHHKKIVPSSFSMLVVGE